MTFIHPVFLYLMLPPVLILFIFLLTQQEQIANFFSQEVLEKLRVRNNRMSLRTRNLIFLLMSILLIVALAQPVVEEGKVKVQAKSADIMVALDISDSMLAEDVYPSRLQQAKQKILDLLALSPQERIGVIAFAKESYLVAPLSFDHRAVTYLVSQLQPTYLTEKGTDIGTLLRSAGEMMKERDKKYLLILTDGGDKELFDDEIALAKELGLTLFILGVGTEKGAPIKSRDGGFVKQNGSIIISKLNPKVADLATETGGSYIEAVSGSEDMVAMLREIEAKTTKRTLAEEEITQYEQLFYYPLGCAMLLLLIATSSMSQRRNVEVPALIIIALFTFLDQPAHAGLLDFKLLDDAKRAYENQDYNASAGLYGDYARRTSQPEALYDHANALYKKGAYAQAESVYQRVDFEDEAHRFDTLHNLGNALAKQGSPESLQKAVEAYEKALAIKEEQPTRENLERVKELLKQQRSPQQKSDQTSDKQDQKQQKEEKGDQQSQQNDSQNREDSKQRKSDQQQSPSDQKNESDASDQQQQAGEESRQQEQQSAPQPEEQPKQQKSAKPEREENRQESGVQPVAESEGQMSDLEESKWLKLLNEQPASHIYRVSPMNKEKESSNAKPW